MLEISFQPHWPEAMSHAPSHPLEPAWSHHQGSLVDIRFRDPWGIQSVKCLGQAWRLGKRVIYN
jgi:hypothetical protein